jgi:hypothetical protein
MKRVVSISLGSSTRNSVGEIEFLNEKVRMERIGTDGDFNKLLQLLRELDGQVDAIGTGGIKLHVHAAGKPYPLRGSNLVVQAVKRTPLVDGSGLKDTIERYVFQLMEEQGIQVKGTKTLLMVGVDRFGMAEALWEMKADVVYGDLLFALNLPIPIRSLRALQFYGGLIGPFLKFIPFKWLYPIGKEQEKITPRFTNYYQWADIIAGDFLYIRRYMPDNLDGKVIVTNTVTAADVEELRKRNVRTLITSSPNIGGRSFATNVLEAMLVALSGKGRPLTHTEYMELLEQIDYQPRIENLQVGSGAQVASND